MNIALTAKSSNAKVGPIPVTTSSRVTCPASCPLIDNGCYASAGFHTRMHWDKVTNGERGLPFNDFIAQVAKMPAGQLWRHNVAGDLAGKKDKINKPALTKLVKANKGKRGFTYTHYPIVDRHNREAVTDANNNGFTVNVSCNTPIDALDIVAAYKLPTVTMVPSDYWANGNRVGPILRCPAETSDTITCKTCKLCAVPNRKDIIGFTVHGTQSKAADIIARG